MASASHSNRRQPSRTARYTASRPPNFYGRTFSGASVEEQNSEEKVAHGFYPAITHFTDAVDALPREVMRHYSLIKEVEAKLVVPDDELRKIAAEIEHLPRDIGANAVPGNNVPPQQSTGGAQAGSSTAPTAAQSAEEQASREDIFRQFMMKVVQISPILDEKIAVLSNTNLELNSQLERMQSSYKYIPDEIPAEARLGSATHWAFITEKDQPVKKSGPERTRREAAAANVYAGGSIQDHDPVSGRGRSEALLGRKSRKGQEQLDSDFEEGSARPTSRKTNKGKKAQLDPDGRSMPGVNSVGTTAKRKKPAAAAQEVRAPLAGVFSITKTRIGSPAGTETSKKRKNPPGNIGGGRKRVATNDARSSPRIPFSSPVMGTFPTKDTSNGRGGHGRGRHGGSTVSTHAALARPSSAASALPGVGLAMDLDPASPLSLPTTHSLKETPGPPGERPPTASGIHGEGALQLDTASAIEDPPLPQQVIVTRTGRVSKAATPLSSTFPEAIKRTKSFNKETDSNNGGNGNDSNGNGNGSHASSETGGAQMSRISTRDRRRGRKDGSPVPSAAESAGAAAVENNESGAAINVEGEDVKPDLVIDTSAVELITSASAPAASKASTSLTTPTSKANSTPTLKARKPTTSSMPELASDVDDEEDAIEDEDIDPDADDEGEEGEEGEDEPRYCYCNGVSYGSMVACDNVECPRQWFHLKCAGLKSPPAEEETWFCEGCKEVGFGASNSSKKGRGGGKRGGGRRD